MASTSTHKNCVLIGAPVETGASQLGCLMGPDALRTAGLTESLSGLGYDVGDWGNLKRGEIATAKHTNPHIKNLNETRAWAEAIADASYRAKSSNQIPIILGGDHSVSIGSVAGIAKKNREAGKPQFVLWLDAHPDIHDLNSTTSGNLHGTPVAYFSGYEGFDGYYPKFDDTVPQENICMIGIRSVDDAERARLNASKIDIHDMRSVDENGILPPLRNFLERVKSVDGELHVSLDVDFLDPQIAPAVGTTVPGGATFREAHLIMETLFDSQLVSSLDLVELNPFLDERGRTAKLMVDLCASLMGRRVLDRLTRSY